MLISQHVLDLTERFIFQWGTIMVGQDVPYKTLIWQNEIEQKLFAEFSIPMCLYVIKKVYVCTES